MLEVNFRYVVVQNKKSLNVILAKRHENHRHGHSVLTPPLILFNEIAHVFKCETYMYRT